VVTRARRRPRFGCARGARACSPAGPSFARAARGEERAIRKVAIVARLKPGAEEAAADLLAAGPPFDPGIRGLTAHSAFLSAGEVVFVFEGAEVDVFLDDIVENPFEPTVTAALDLWRPLIDGSPRIARPQYDWSREAE
jgi:hypothetical protein